MPLLKCKQKGALETASVTSDEAHQPTVISSADGAKVLKNLDKLVDDLRQNGYSTIAPHLLMLTTTK